MLDVEQLIDYVARAKGAGATDDAATGVFLLLYRYEDRIRDRVRLRLPRHLHQHADTVADWVLERIVRSALKLHFEGSSTGEWVNWWSTAVQRQVISFWRSPQGRALEAERALPSEHEEEEGVHDTLGVDFGEDRIVARMDYDAAIDAVLKAMANEQHVAIVRAAFWDDRASLDIAGDFETSGANVDQIKTRFRRDLRTELERRGVSGP